MNKLQVMLVFFGAIPLGYLLTIDSQPVNPDAASFMINALIVFSATTGYVLLTYAPVFRIVGGPSRFAFKYGAPLFLFSAVWGIFFSVILLSASLTIVTYQFLIIGLGAWPGYILALNIKKNVANKCPITRH